MCTPYTAQLSQEEADTDTVRQLFWKPTPAAVLATSVLLLVQASTSRPFPLSYRAFLSLCLDVFEEHRPVILYNVPPFGFVWGFLTTLFLIH